MLLRQIYDPDLSQYAYLIGCEKTREAIVIDPERDIDRYLAIAAGEGVKLNLRLCMERVSIFLSESEIIFNLLCLATCYDCGRRRTGRPVL